MKQQNVLSPGQEVVRQGWPQSTSMMDIYREKIAGLEEDVDDFKIGERNKNNCHYAIDTTMVAENANDPEL